MLPQANKHLEKQLRNSCQEPNAGAAGSVGNENQRLARSHRRCYRSITRTRRSAVSLGAVSPFKSVQRGVARQRDLCLLSTYSRFSQSGDARRVRQVT